jgi:hypothetical protein
MPVSLIHLAFGFIAGLLCADLDSLIFGLIVLAAWICYAIWRSYQDGTVSDSVRGPIDRVRGYRE